MQYQAKDNDTRCDIFQKNTQQMNNDSFRNYKKNYIRAQIVSTYQNQKKNFGTIKQAKYCKKTSQLHNELRCKYVITR